jgi:hypothetical protein
MIQGDRFLNETMRIRGKNHGDRFLNEFPEFIQKPVPMILWRQRRGWRKKNGAQAVSCAPVVMIVLVKALKSSVLCRVVLSFMSNHWLGNT